MDGGKAVSRITYSNQKLFLLFGGGEINFRYNSYKPSKVSGLFEKLQFIGENSVDIKIRRLGVLNQIVQIWIPTNLDDNYDTNLIQI